MKATWLSPIGLAGMILAAACSSHLPSTPEGPRPQPSFGGQVQVTSGTTILTTLRFAGYTTQYMASDVEKVAIGLYDIPPSDPAPPTFIGPAFSPSGIFRIDNQAETTLLTAISSGDIPYISQLRNLFTAPNRNYNSRYMIQVLTTQGGSTGPLSATFMQIPDGSYTLFVAAIRRDVPIGLGTTPLLISPDQRNANGVIPAIVTCTLDSNPDLSATIHLIDGQPQPSF